MGPQDTSSCYGGGATATQALCSSSSREMQRQLCPARARAFHAPATHAPFRPDPNQPLPSRADLNFTQEAAETKSYHIHRHHRLSVSQPCSDSLLPSPQGHWRGETEQETSKPKPPPLLPAAMHPSSSHLEGGGLGSDVTESQWEQSTLGIEGLTVCWAVAFEACPPPHTHTLVSSLRGEEAQPPSDHLGLNSQPRVEEDAVVKKLLGAFSQGHYASR